MYIIPAVRYVWNKMIDRGSKYTHCTHPKVAVQTYTQKRQK